MREAGALPAEVLGQLEAAEPAVGHVGEPDQDEVLRVRQVAGLGEVVGQLGLEPQLHELERRQARSSSSDSHRTMSPA